MFYETLEAAAKYIGFVSLAAIGGVLGYITRTLDQKEQVLLVRVFVEAASAAFVGTLVLLFCLASGINQLWMGIVIGLAGWAGASASITLLGGIVKKRFGVNLSIKGDDNEDPKV